METVNKDDVVITLTESAAGYVKRLRDKEAENAGKALRVFVEGGGCSGFQYGMTFDEKHEDDHAAEFHGVPVLVDPESAKQLHGAVVDYKDELNGGGFKISNPNAKQSCGCGKSFDACG
jgi:iron-sulfur cluster assembly accessory protein